MTTGSMMFYGGIAGMILFAALFVASWIIFGRKKKELIRKIEQEL